MISIQACRQKKKNKPYSYTANYMEAGMSRSVLQRCVIQGVAHVGNSLFCAGGMV